MSGRIVLAYAKDRFKPGEKPKDGIGLVSKAFFESLVSVFPKHELIYLDFSEHALLRGMKGVERIFTISQHIDKFVSASKSSEVNLISVNEHALMRRRVRRYARERGIPSSFLEPHDGIRSNLRETNGISNIIAFGSWNTYKSYELLGFNPQKIYAIGWKYWETTRDSRIPGPRKTILCYLGAICVRKGVYEIEALIKLLKTNYSEYKLHLVGFVNNADLRAWILSLVNKYPYNFAWSDKRVHYGEESWLGLRDNVAFAIFPSWEEGLSGCLMDTINLGIPVIHSDRAGLEFAHSFVKDVDFFSDSWLHSMEELIQKGEALWNEISESQKRAAFFQYKGNRGIEKVLARLAVGNLWPTLRVNQDILGENDYSNLSANFHVDSNLPEFILKEREASDQNCIELHTNARSNQTFSFIERLRLSIMVLDRYSEYSALNLALFDGGDVATLKFHKHQNHEKQFRENLNLWVSSYNQGHQPQPVLYKMFRASESIRDMFYLNFRYRPRRFINIVYLKFRKEFQVGKSILFSRTKKPQL